MSIQILGRWEEMCCRSETHGDSSICLEILARVSSDMCMGDSFGIEHCHHLSIIEHLFGLFLMGNYRASVGMFLMGK